MGAPAEQVVVGQLGELLTRRLDQLGVAEAQPAAPEARQPLDVFAPLVVIDMDTLAGFDQMRPDPAVGDGVGVGMQQGLDIAGLGIGQGSGVIGPARTSIYTNAIPIVAMLCAAVWLGESITGNKAVGAAAVVGGVLLTRMGRPSVVDVVRPSPQGSPAEVGQHDRRPEGRDAHE